MCVIIIISSFSHLLSDSFSVKLEQQVLPVSMTFQIILGEFNIDVV